MREEIRDIAIGWLDIAFEHRAAGRDDKAREALATAKGLMRGAVDPLELFDDAVQDILRARED